MSHQVFEDETNDAIAAARKAAGLSPQGGETATEVRVHDDDDVPPSAPPRGTYSRPAPAAAAKLIVTVQTANAGTFRMDAVEVSVDAEGTLGILFDHTQGERFQPLFEARYVISWGSQSADVIYHGAKFKFANQPHTLVGFLIEPKPEEQTDHDQERQS